MRRPATMRGLAWPVLAFLPVLACDAAPPTPHAQRQPVAADEPAARPPSAAAAQATKTPGPSVVEGAQPVAPFVAEQLLAAHRLRTVVYVGARWCEPCRRFHHALDTGELDAELPGVRFIEYDYDAAEPALYAAGYRSRLIPLFALPAPDGRASARMIAGSIKGAGAVANILPRLKALLAAP